MSKQTDSSFFIIPPLTKLTGFYQDLLGGIRSYSQLGNRLIRLGEHAHAFRQFDRVKEVGQLLSNLPIKSYQAIGHYFLAVAANSAGNGDQEQAQKLFELTVETAPIEYKSKALLSLAAVSINTGNFDLGFYYYNETIKAGALSPTSIEAMKGIGVLKALEGYHPQATSDLENMLPIIKFAQPHIYFDCLNSLAVEFGEAGRKNEARIIINHVIASPFALAYPEWQDTARDLKEPNRSFVAVPQIVPKPVKPPQPVIKPQRPASVLTFPKLKEVPLPEKPEQISQQEIDDMDLTEKRETVLAAIRAGTIQEREYKKIMSMLGLVKSGPADKVIDLEDEALLADIIIEWCNMIEPEQFTAVMSALRDCKDDYRRETIIDSMITLAFQQTRDCIDSETEWRLKVERRLPKK